MLASVFNMFVSAIWKFTIAVHKEVPEILFDRRSQLYIYVAITIASNRGESG